MESHRRIINEEPTMILLLIEVLKEFNVRVPTVFTYYSTRMILAAMTSLLLSLFMGPFFIRKLYELKIGQPIRKEDCPLLGQLHEKKQNTPTMGGLLILFCMVVSLLLWMDLTHVFTIILLITTLFLGFIGGRDDYLKLKYKNTKGMSGKKKLLYQGILSAGIATYFLVGPQVSNTENSWLQPPVIKEFNLTSSAQQGIANKAIFVISSQEPAERKEVDVKDRDEGIALAIAEERSLTDAPLQPVGLSDEIMKVAANNEADSQKLSLTEYASRIYLPFFKEPVLILSGVALFLMFFFIFFVIAGCSNAVNLTDGLDGLATGCIIMVAAALGLVAFVSNHIEIARYLNTLYIEGSGEIAIYLCALMGACLGFLWYNGYPAQVFMGDTGSLAMGGVIGVSAVLLRREFFLGLVGGVFVAEALSVILQVLSYRYRNKKRIFLIAPLHHHFEYKGWPETKVVVRFWIVGLLLALIGVASLKFQ